MTQVSKFLFFISFSFLLEFTFSQNQNINIDKINTKEEVQNLIHLLDNRLGNFELKSIGEYKNRHDKNNFCERTADSLQITKSFYKGDFDNNGLTDILAIGSYYDFKIIVVMNFGKDSLMLNSLTRRSFQSCVFPKIVNDTIIDYYYKTQQSWDRKEKSRFVKKPLIYKFNDFIELNTYPTRYSIEKIEFETTPCFGSCPIFQMTINKDKTAKLVAKRFNRKMRKSKDIKGKFETTLKDNSFNEIIDLLNYINFPELKDNYAVSWTDDQTSTLKITYNNGKVKEIRDYGLIGTYGLDRLYQLLFELRFNQNWN